MRGRACVAAAPAGRGWGFAYHGVCCVARLGGEEARACRGARGHVQVCGDLDQRRLPRARLRARPPHAARVGTAGSCNQQGPELCSGGRVLEDAVRGGGAPRNVADVLPALEAVGQLGSTRPGEGGTVRGPRPGDAGVATSSGCVGGCVRSGEETPRGLPDGPARCRNKATSARRFGARGSLCGLGRRPETAPRPAALLRVVHADATSSPRTSDRGSAADIAGVAGVCR
mmetsp:Transcript_108586/g.346141  ORF Transcript_108586/g.346141 Transcript_108586/m.346141 type:complete len:229 (+) Transcript_108586:415-1101(+)